ncbi:hypothetical protein CGRA01v4_03636 [Colletotrichum graminicola]|nr:hypothetical protein CGRA01v4_03636 [Colletotrichum graminicola]
MLSYNDETKSKHQIPASSALLATLFCLFVNHATPCQPPYERFRGDELSTPSHKQACPARRYTAGQQQT